MSEDLLKILERRLSEADRGNAGLQAEIKSLRKAKREISEKLESIQAEGGKYSESSKSELALLEKDRDVWKSKAEAAPSEKDAQIAELSGKIRERDHRDAWKDAIGKDLHEKASVDDVWAKVGYKPEADVIDVNQINELVNKARDLASYMFVSRDDTGSVSVGKPATQSVVKPPLTGGETTSRGARDTAIVQLRYGKAETQKAGWMNTARGREIVAHMTAGTAVLDE